MIHIGQNFFQLSDAVYGFVFPDHDDLGNTGIVITEAGVVVIDTDIRSVDLLFETLPKLTDKPVKFLINTHHAFDHSSANCVFADKGATIIGSEQCRKEMILHGENNIKRWLERKPVIKNILDQKKITLSPPNVTFDHELRLHLAGESIEMFHYGHAHTPGDIVVYLPKEEVLFGGDLLWFGMFPNVREAHIPNQIDVVNRLLEFSTRYYVPGHGYISSDRSDVIRMREFLENIYNSIHTMVKENRDFSSIQGLEDMWVKKYPEWRARRFLSRAINVIYENLIKQH